MIYRAWVNLSLRFYFLFFLCFNQLTVAQTSLVQVTNFGSNPGNLNMYTYTPYGISTNAPLVIVLHGCGQDATTYATQSGWNKLADLHKFYVAYPEQKTANNSSNCFNWFQSSDTDKDKGEALSIKQMVDYMQGNYSVNTSMIFITGLSAGAGMSAAMLADYPSTFKKGAIMAGVPYKAATSSFFASTAMAGGISYAASRWGDSVRIQNPNYSGVFPDVAIFHGIQDLVVNVANATELIKQWTNVNNADQLADATFSGYLGNSVVEKTVYTDNQNNPVVEYFKFSDMGHAIALDTGACPRQGGETGYYSSQEDFHSTYWAADFFGILTPPYSISGLIQVSVSATNVTYSVSNTSGSSYEWWVPSGTSIVNGQGTNSITINFGSISGDIKVVETTATFCIRDTAKLFVTVDIASGIQTISTSKISTSYSKNTNSICISGLETKRIEKIAIYNALGQKENQAFTMDGNNLLLTNDLTTGIYLIKIRTEQQEFISKIVVF